MSDSTKSSVGFLSNWKFNLAVCIPCFAVGLGAVTYYFYSKSQAKHNDIDTNTVKIHNQTPSEKVKELKKLGNVEFVKQNYDSAIDIYTQALSMCPEFEKKLMSNLYYNRANAYNKLNNYKNCVADCNKALVIVPVYVKALFQRAKALAEMGNFKLALEDITVVLVTNESQYQEAKELANSIVVRLGMQNLKKFKKNNFLKFPTKIYIENYMNSFSDNLFNDEYPQTLMQSEVNTGLELALKCLKDKIYENIVPACKEELNKTDNSLIRRTLTLNLLASIFIVCGNYAKGVEHLTTVIETSGVPNKLVINSLIKRALVYYEQEQVQNSFEDLKRAENIDPNSSVIFYHRAKIYLVIDCEKAVEDLRRAVELNPTFILSNVHLCYAQYIHAKETSNEYNMVKFLNSLKSCVSKNPNCGETYILCAQALIVKGEFAEADLLYKKVSELYPENTTYLVERALLKFLWKNSESEVYDLLHQALHVNPECDYTYETLGKFFIRLGKYKEAIQCFKKAIFFSTTEKRLLKLFSFKNGITAQLAVLKRLKIKII